MALINVTGRCKNLPSLTKALLSKWSWRFANEKGAWWVEVTRRKYGEEEEGGRVVLLFS